MPCSDVFCTIRSTLMSRSARARNSRPATPGWSGTPATVTLASSVSCTTAEMMACSMSISSLVTSVPGLPGERGPHVQVDAVGPGVLDRPHGRLGAAVGRHLEQLVEADALHLAGVGHHPGIAGEHARHVGVELADVGAQGVGQGHGRGVGAAAAQEGDVAIGGHALGPAHHRHPAGVDRLADPVGPHLEDLGVGVGGVGDEAGLAAGERLGLDPDVVQRQAQQRGGLALAGGDEHVHLAARAGCC